MIGEAEYTTAIILTKTHFFVAAGQVHILCLRSVTSYHPAPSSV